MKYGINWLKEQAKKEARLKYVFFWGDKPRKDGQVGKSCLSQWWFSDFEKDGITYPTAEHWMMAEKASAISRKFLAPLSCSFSPTHHQKIGHLSR